jgi:phosphonate transport system substrate-binding protein
VIAVAQRAEDQEFRSVFITAEPDIRQLSDLKGKDVSFGSQSSTSGHLMPRSFLLQAGLVPERDFHRVAFSGAHDATIAAVASGGKIVFNGGTAPFTITLTRPEPSTWMT